MQRDGSEGGALARLAKLLRLAATLLLIGLGGTACSEDGKAPSNSGNPDAGPTGDSPLADKCTDAECTPQGMQCDPFEGCVSCLLDAHCPPGLRCFDRGCEPAFPCATTADCSSHPTLPACDPVSKECVRCAADGDCAGTAHCTDNRCLPYVACVNSFDCPDGKVCNRDIGECVECFQPGDCDIEGGEACIRNRCTPVCLSDNDCRPLNKLCDPEGLFCASCIRHEDCPDAYHCDANECVLDTCAHGSTRCDADVLSTCLPYGEGYEAIPCGYGYSCVAEGVARCASWVCTPNTTACDADAKNVVDCSSDGMSTTVRAACEAEGKVCRFGACVDLVCTPGATFCSLDGNLSTCGDDGTTFATLRTCSSTEYCDATGATCLPRVCEPGVPLCDGQRSTVCAANGSGPAPDGTDCSANGQVCEVGACRALVCTPSQAVCNAAGEVETCNATGTEASTSACGVGTYCGILDGQATCRLQTCVPGEPACDGSRSGTCNATGSGLDAAVDCAAGEACFGGACRPIVCRGSYDCIDNSVYRCINQGTASTLSTNCPNSVFGVAMHCEKSGDLADCVANRCTPGLPACDGSFLTTCNSIGSGYEPGGTDCSTTGTLCLGGACQPVICNGTRDCIGGAVHTCYNQGTSSSLYSSCSTTTHCEKSGTSAACVTNTCTPGAVACNGNTLTRCNATGSGYEPGGTDCTATGGVCYIAAPQCLPKICEPSAYYCKSGTGKNGDVYRCGPDGATDSLYWDCVASQYCSQSGTTVSCVADICTENQLGCDGSRVATCNADGSGFLAGGTDCTTQPGTQNCRAGACHDVICDANETYCVDTTLTRCDATGTQGTASQFCTGTMYCEPESGAAPAACKPDFCSPSGAACNGETTTTCGADGGSYAPGGTDCSATGTVCDISSSTAQCAAQATDTIASAAASITGTNTLALNAYSVRTNRSLVEIQQSMRLATGTSIVTWVVFERTGSTGSYTRIFDRAVPTTGDGTMKLQSSGAMDVNLLAGREYLVGFWGSTTAGVANTFQYYYPSFGPYLGRHRTTATSLPATQAPLGQYDTGHHQVLKTGP